MISRNNRFSLIIGALGCLLYFCLISSQYFKFETESEQTFLVDDFFVSPAMTLCMPFAGLVKPGVTLRWSQLSYNKLMENTYDFEDIFHYYEERKPGAHGVFRTKKESLRQLTLRSFINGGQKCFTLSKSANETERYSRREILYDLEFSGMLYRLALDKAKLSKVTSIYLHLHDHQRLPRAPDRTKMEISLERHREFGFSIIYKSFIQENLPPPFESRCKNYSDVGLESAAHCIQQCVLEESTRKFSRIPYISAITEDSPEVYKSMPLIGPHEFLKFVEIQDQTILISHHCHQTCQNVNCNEIHYVPSLRHNPAYSSGIRFEIYALDLPDEVIILRPKMCFNDYAKHVVYMFGFLVLLVFNQNRAA